MSEVSNKAVGRLPRWVRTGNEAFIAAHATETIPCPLCGGTQLSAEFSAGDYEYGLAGEFFVSRCDSCSLVLQSPRPKFEEILRYYPTQYNAFLSDKAGLALRIKRAVLYGPRKRLYRRLLGTTGTILDIGCGDGSLLGALKGAERWDLYGVEPGRTEQTVHENEIKIYSGTLEQAAFADESIDLAIMNHVLEHVPDPRATLTEVLRILRPGGYLCGEVPDLQCAERAIFGKYWAGYHLPRHLTFFDQRTLLVVLKETGFTDISLKRKMQPSSWLVSASNLVAGRYGRGLVWVFSERNIAWLAATTPIAWLLSKLGSAPSVEFIARKRL